MRYAPLLLVLAACPGGDNADVLWLAPDMAETRVKLVEREPFPF